MELHVRFHMELHMELRMELHMKLDVEIHVELHVELDMELHMKLCMEGYQSTIAAVAASSAKAHEGVCMPPLLDSPSWQGEGDVCEGNKRIHVNSSTQPDYPRVGQARLVLGRLD